MRIGILSDIHDHVWNLRAALPALQDADTLLVAGDLCSPFVIPILGDGFTRGRIHVVFGNNDGDRFRMTMVAQAFEHVELHGEVYRGRLDGHELVMNHFPALAEPMDAARIPLIVYGHDHRYHVERTGPGADAGWRLNPGTLLGYDPLSGEDVPATFLVLDTGKNAVESFQVAQHGAGHREVVPYRP
ncbi:MAG: metallophosphoesterase family protein [Deinococcales bacterium]